MPSSSHCTALPIPSKTLAKAGVNIAYLVAALVINAKIAHRYALLVAEWQHDILKLMAGRVVINLEGRFIRNEQKQPLNDLVNGVWASIGDRPRIIGGKLSTST